MQKTLFLQNFSEKRKNPNVKVNNKRRLFDGTTNLFYSVQQF